MNVLLALLLAASAAPSAPAPRTFRVDYFHTGNATEERFSLDRLVVEPLPWPGNPARAVDETNLGKYLFEVRDRRPNSCEPGPTHFAHPRQVTTSAARNGHDPVPNFEPERGKS